VLEPAADGSAVTSAAVTTHFERFMVPASQQAALPNAFAALQVGRGVCAFGWPGCWMLL
jgi:hypothetical protein